MLPHYQVEASLYGTVCGIDEAGRGALAGPVFAAAVILDPARIPEGINDSKQIPPWRRQELSAAIHANAHVGIGIATALEIDAINILQASMLAMQRAFHALPHQPQHALIDGNRAPVLPCITQTLIKGDTKSLSIAAASIIAKVARDTAMRELHGTLPHYGFDRHAGYGTKFHLEALGSHGASEHHRQSFRPVREVLYSFLINSDYNSIKV